MCIRDSVGRSRNRVTTRSDRQLAAEQGDLEAQWHLGRQYRDGDMVPQDFTQAHRWIRMAADQGNAEAQNALALSLIHI